MKIRCIWVNDVEAWEDAWLFHAEDEYTSDENDALWPEKLAEAHKAYEVVRIATINVPEKPIVDLFEGEGAVIEATIEETT